MEQINLPPFYVGQRVVCVDDYWSGDLPYPKIKKGNIIIVMGIMMGHCTWLIDVGIESGMPCYACSCGKRSIPKPNTSFWVRASRFAPIQENFQSISLEKILEQETKLISVN